MRQEFSEGLNTARRLPRQDDRPTREIVAEVWEKAELLVRKELELAVTEVEQKAAHLKEDVKSEIKFASAGLAALCAGGLALVATAILLLCKVVEPWLAALIVGLVGSAGGYALLRRAKHISPTGLEPTMAKESIQRSATTIKEAVHDSRS